MRFLVWPARPLIVAVVTVLTGALLPRTSDAAATALTGFGKSEQVDNAWIITTDSGQKLRITPYGSKIIRVQAAAAGEPFVADDRYGMVLSHAPSGSLSATEDASKINLATKPSSGDLEVQITKSPVRLQIRAGGVPMVGESILGGLVTGDRPLEIKVNGVAAAAALPFPVTGAWTRWRTVSVSAQLPAGQSLVRATAAGANGGNIDSLKIGATIYEAENAAKSGAAFGNQNGGFTGTGYVDFQNASADYVEWTVSVATAGSYALEFRYANAAPVSEIFAPAANEHFFGLGYGAYGRVDKLDLRGQTITRNRENQAPLLVPFFLSSRGYGVFVNSPYQNSFSFTDGSYQFSLSGGQIDYFFIEGPELPDVLDHYTQLTGRPRMPPLAAFGLGLSDKIGDSLPSNEMWWKDKVAQMRDGKYPFDLVIHDNCWRNGKTAPWQWDLGHYPDPPEYEKWSQDNGITNQLDFNRADSNLSAGWQASYAMPGTTDWPDFSSPTVRAWFWNLLSSKSFDPALKYPGDFMWLDEPDEDVTPSGALADGRFWDEDANSYFFLQAQAVGEGWDATFKGDKRPYIMSRGMTAGAQRWASVWTGDINDTYDEMKLQIRGMLASGLSAFPYWAHDAGGFHTLPTDAMYRQWSVAMGSFSPMWKPHGIGLRFPWQFSKDAQNDMRTYGDLRMRLIPYLSTTAYIAATSGLPIARAMVLDHREDPEAWAADQQYMWGSALLVAPNTSDAGTVTVWLPAGDWYDFWDDTKMGGGTRIKYPAPTGKLPIFVKAGAIVPGALPMQGTKFWDKATRILDVYVGGNGAFTQFEDDGHSDHFTTGQRALTSMSYEDAAVRLTLAGDDGSYPGAPAKRSYRVRFHGLPGARPMQVNGQPVATKGTEAEALADSMGGVVWDATAKVLTVYTPALPVTAKVIVEPSGPTVPGADGGIPRGGDGGGTTGDGGDAGLPGVLPDDQRQMGGCGCHEAPSGTTGGLLAALSGACLFMLRRRRRD